MKKLALLLAMISTGASAVLIDFTYGYTADRLNGQQDWNAGQGWTVAPRGKGSVSNTETGQAATLNQAIVLSASGFNIFNMRINFQFTGHYATPTDLVYAFMAGLKLTNDYEGLSMDDAVGADVNLQLMPAPNCDDYRLLNDYNHVYGAYPINGKMNPLAAGDILVFDYSLTLGADAASSFYTVRLQNITDGTDTGIGTISGISTEMYSALTGAGAYAYFQTINEGANGSGLTGVQINTFSTEVVPAANTYGMLDIGTVVTQLN